MSLSLFARDPALRRTGQVDDFLSLTLQLRFNRSATWILELDASSSAVPLLPRTGGLIVERDGETLLSGPVVSIDRQSSRDRSSVTIIGADDSVWLERRLALPVPAGPPYTAAEYDDKQGPAETVLRWYVDRNLGPSAIVARRLPYLTLAADLARGSTVRGFGRFHPLTELLQPLALAGGDLGFRIVQVGTTLEFQVYEPQDLTATAVFSRELGNLADYAYRSAAPVADYVYVGGQGEGTAREFTEGGTDQIDVYGRIEQFRDRRDIDDPAVLPQALAEALAELQPPTGLSLSPIDTAAVSFGTDYTLGDRVTVMMVEGEQIQDVVREVTLTYTAERGEQITPLVASPGGNSPQALALFARQERLDRRINNQERR